MGIGITSAFSLFLPLLLVSGNFVAQPPYVKGAVGNDISYPNCSMTLTKKVFVIVGVNGGKVASSNPCFLRQAMLFGSAVSLYVNTGWNDKVGLDYPKRCIVSDKRYKNCLAYNYGYAAGSYAYHTAANRWIRSNMWWLDVETSNTWSDDVIQNRNSLQGEYDALKDQGISTVGAYSTSYQWQKITGNWKNNWPNWGATVVPTASEAKYFCKEHEFTGGPTLLVQYKPKDSTIDHDIAC